VRFPRSPCRVHEGEYLRVHVTAIPVLLDAPRRNIPRAAGRDPDRCRSRRGDLDLPVDYVEDLSPADQPVLHHLASGPNPGEGDTIVDHNILIPHQHRGNEGVDQCPGIVVPLDPFFMSIHHDQFAVGPAGRYPGCISLDVDFIGIRGLNCGYIAEVSIADRFDGLESAPGQQNQFSFLCGERLTVTSYPGGSCNHVDDLARVEQAVRGCVAFPGSMTNYPRLTFIGGMGVSPLMVSVMIPSLPRIGVAVYTGSIFHLRDSTALHGDHAPGVSSERLTPTAPPLRRGITGMSCRGVGGLRETSRCLHRGRQ